MADRQIGSLPKATEMDEESLLVVEQQNTAKSITGELVAQYAREATEGYAEQAKESAESAKKDADRAQEYADTIEIDYDYIEQARTDAQTSATEAAGSAAEALKSQEAASQSEKNAASSETKAKASQDAALASQTAANLSEMAAKASQEAASASEGKAAKSADAAQASQEAAAKSAETAKQYSGNPPEIDEDGFWETWDADAQKYTSTGEKAVNHWDKTYKTVEEMQADSSQPKNTVCIISSDVEQEENARVYMWDGEKWNFLCDLSGLQGVGVAKIELTGGDHAPGTDDTYTITLTDRREYTFTVHNGSESPVLSVNGHEGEVQLTAEDVGALPANGKAKTAGTADKVEHSLKFTGGSTVTFDGTAEQTVNIPVVNEWTVSVPSTLWISANDSWNGIAAKWSAQITCTGMTANTDITNINFASGDLDAAATWNYLRPGVGIVTLFSVDKPSANFVLTLKEVKRNG